MHSGTSHRSCRRTGTTAVLVAAIIPVLLLIVGFSVDLAYMQLARAELRAATDMAAKAASAELADTGSTALAIAKGQQVADLNLVAGDGLTLEPEDFVFGNTTRSTAGKWVFAPNAEPTNSVQVSSRRIAGAPDGEVGLFFSGLMGGGGFSTGASATSAFINADICLVLDRSSSMKLAVSNPAIGMGGGDPRRCETPWADSRWTALENAVNIFISKMQATLADEQVAVVTFASNNSACSQSISAASLDHALTTDMPSITSAMSTLSSSVWNGNTEISVGMNLARAELTSANARPTAQKIMIVLTDGAYTNGIHPSGQAALAADEGIVVHTITFGGVPSGVIGDMQSTAAAGGGEHFHAPDPATLNDVFSKIAGSIAILTQ